MQSRSIRRFAFFALLAGGVVVLGLGWPDDMPRDAGSSTDAHTAASDNPPASAGARPPSAAIGRDSISSPPAMVEPSRPPSQAQIRLEVRAPSDVRLGETFQARVEIDARAPVRDLIFSITYERSRLRLVGRSEGEFVRQAGVPSDFGVDEPSDGNVLVVYNARNGFSASGTGTLIVFELEAIGPGTSAIALQDVQANGVGGEGNPGVIIADERVVIH